MGGVAHVNRREAIAALVSLPAAATVTRAAVGPRDVIVFEYDGPISEAHRAAIEKAARSVWPENKIVVLGDGMKLKIVRASDA